jgi:hypothetical protein
MHLRQARLGPRLRRQLAPLFSRALAATLIALACLGGPLLGEAAAEEPAPRQRLGEAFIWNVRFLGLFDAGRARLAISPPAPGPQGQPTVNVIGEVEATGLIRALLGLHADYRVILDGTSLAPRRLEIEESGYRTRTIQVTVNGRNIEQYARKPGKEIRLPGQLPSEPLEPVAVILLLRAARLAQGDRLQLIVMDGADLYQGVIEVVGREELRSAMGTQSAIKLSCRGERINHLGQSLGKPPRQATLWVSDDTYRLPLRVEAQTAYGTGQFELTNHEPARRPIPIPAKPTGITESFRAPAVATPAQPPAH